MNFDSIFERPCENVTTTSTPTTSTTSTTPGTTSTSTTPECGAVAYPTFSPASGSMVSFPVDVTIAGPGALYYTLDGSNPSPTHGTLYTGSPVSVAHGQTIRAIAVQPGCGECSSMISAAFYLNTTTTTPTTPSTSTTTNLTSAPSSSSTTTIPTTTQACPQDYDQIIPVITALIPSYFNGSSPLPPGVYVVTYVEGALRYGPDHLWSLNFNFAINEGYKILYNSGSTVRNGPGSAGEFANQAAVEAFNAGMQVTFQHLGGTIGVVLSDNLYSDNIAGSPNPTFLLTRLCDLTTPTTPVTTAAPTTTAHTTAPHSTTLPPTTSLPTTTAHTTTPHTTGSTTRTPTTAHGSTTPMPDP